VKNALKYKCDASFLLSLAQENMIDLMMRTPKWCSLYCENHQLAIAVNNATWPNYKPIHILAATFVEKIRLLGNQH
jgi:hypothetical protein